MNRVKGIVALLACVMLAGGGSCGNGGPAGQPIPLAVNAGDHASVAIDSSLPLSGSATGGKGPYTYLWKQGPGPAQTLTDATSATANVTGLALGTTVFKLTVTDDEGTAASDEVSVTVTPSTQLAVNAGDDASVVIDSSLPLSGSVTGGKAPYTYLWKQGPGPAQTLTDATSATANVTGIAVGTTVFKLTVTDDEGTAVSDEVSVSVSPSTQLAVNAGGDASVAIDASLPLSGSATGGQAPYTYLWKEGPGPAQTLTNATSATANVTGIAVGTTVFKLTVTDSKGTAASDEVSVTVTLPAGVRTVLAGAAGAGNGLTWADAFADLQKALAAAEGSNGAITELWVAKGTYKPAEPEGNRSATFKLMSGLLVYGRFAGTEVRRTERDVTKNITILSGDLNNDDLVGSGPNFMNFGENVYTVVTARDVSTAVLDGFHILGGGTPGRGGGMVVSANGMKVSHCTFGLNLASGPSAGGAAIYQLKDSISTNVEFESCVFSSNSALIGGACYSDAGSLKFTDCSFIANTADRGGAIYYSGESLTLEGCSFTSNLAGTLGGAIEQGVGSLVVDRCTFTTNTAETPAGGAGGAVSCGGTSMFFTNSLFVRNHSKNAGGAIHSQGQNLYLTNCAFSGNTSFNQGGVYTQADATTVTGCTFSGNRAANTGCGFQSSDPATVTNSIFWGNTSTSPGTNVISTQLGTNSGAVQNNVSYSDVQGNAGGALGGTSNIGADPLFLNAANDDLRLSSNSPCINAGSNTYVYTETDLGGKPRIKGAPPVVDMGAYEY